MRRRDRFVRLIGSALLLTAVLSASAGCHLVGRTVDDPLGLEMVRVDGGTFTMGDVFEHANEDALPVHQVEVETFYLSRYEVTYEQYDAWAEAAGRPPPPDDGYGRGRRAVVYVSWDAASAFCQAQGYRLPSEAEWEYAARSGGLPQRYAGTDDLGELDAYAFYAANSPPFALPVGLKKPNALGLHDLTGNVAEWVGAFYETYPAEGERPRHKDLRHSGMRLARGGSFYQTEEIGRTYWRAGTLNDVAAFSIGFRCAD